MSGTGHSVSQMPLVLVQAGRRVRLVTIDTDQNLRGRLTAMGLVPGVQITVVRNSMNGPFLIEVRDSHMMLGRGVAEKILVR